VAASDNTEVTKSKKSRAKTHLHVHLYHNLDKPTVPSPGLNDALSAVTDYSGNDAMKSNGLSTGNPIEHAHAHSDTGGYQDRTSPPIMSGHASYSTGDHNLGENRNPGLAVAHMDLRQSHVNVSDAIARLHTERGNVVDLNVPAGTSGGFSHQGRVALQMFDARSGAGRYAGMQDVNSDPSRPAAHQSRNSAVLPNPEMPPLDAQLASQSRHPVSAKASPLDIIKAEMRRQGVS
jgi:hypothetical protein